MAMLPRLVPVAGSVCLLAACIGLSPAIAAAEEHVDPQDGTEAAADEATIVVPDELDSMIDDAMLDDVAPSEATPSADEDDFETEEGPDEVVVTPGEAAPEDADDPLRGVAHDDIEEIVVMANKRAESIQDVAVSVTALDNAFIESAGLTDFSDIQKFVSNLSIEGGTDTRSTSIRIRGIGSVGTNAGIDPSVGLFIDGVYQGRAGMSMGDLIDIEAVEVLRGPQGTLYGKNTAAGLISIRTQRPEYEFSSLAEFTAGSKDTFAGRGSVNIPLVDGRVATRFSGYRSLRDGWDENLFDGDDVNDEDKWGVRNKWLLDISDDVSLLVAGDYAKEDSSCCVADIITYEGDSLLWRGNVFRDANGKVVPSDNPNLNPNFAKLGTDLDGFNPCPTSDPCGFYNPGPPSTLRDDPFIGNTVDPPKPALRNFRAFDEQVDVDREPENEVQIWGVQTELSVGLGEWDLNWLSAYRAYDTDSQFDGDFSQYNAVVSDTEEELDQFSTELRLQSPLGDLVDFTTGLFFFYLDHETFGTIGFDQDYADIFQVGYMPLINNDTSRHQTWSYAGYGQFNLNISERARFTGGLRASHEHKSIDGSQISTSQIPAPPVSGPDEFRNDSRDTTNVSGTARMQFFPTEDSMVYASFASGFKSGGFNQLRTAQDVDDEFDDEQAMSYELGLRSTWLDGLVTFNLTGFFTDYDDFQAQSFTGTSIAIRNAGSFYSYGLESDLIVTPLENLMWRTALGFNITEYQDFDAAENTVQNIVDLGAQISDPRANGLGWAPFLLSLNLTSNDPETQQILEDAGITTTAQDLSDERLDNAPRWSLSTSLDYSWPILNLPVSWVFHTDYSFRSSIFLNQDLDRNVKEDPLHLVALRTGIREENDTWELIFWVRNLLDEEYMVASFDVPVLGGFAGLHGPPRHYGGTVRVRF
jgi:iron complex outermembrane receptor protein